MKYKDISIVESVSQENNYQVKRQSRFNVLNVLIVQSAICLAVSLGMLAVRCLGMNDVVEAVNNLVNIYI